ncbi:MAG: hypothetical protein ACLUDU_02150 [Butyricimonas faecihominis]
MIRKGFVVWEMAMTSKCFRESESGSSGRDEKHVATIMFDRLKMATGLLYTPE